MLVLFKAVSRSGEQPPRSTLRLKHTSESCIEINFTVSQFCFDRLSFHLFGIPFSPLAHDLPLNLATWRLGHFIDELQRSQPSACPQPGGIMNKTDSP